MNVHVMSDIPVSMRQSYVFFPCVHGINGDQELIARFYLNEGCVQTKGAMITFVTLVLIKLTTTVLILTNVKIINVLRTQIALTQRLSFLLESVSAGNNV